MEEKDSGHRLPAVNTSSVSGLMRAVRRGSADSIKIFEPPVKEKAEVERVTPRPRIKKRRS